MFERRLEPGDIRAQLRAADNPCDCGAEGKADEEECNWHPSPPTIGRGSDGRIGGGPGRPDPLVVLALRPGFGSLVPLLLCHLLMLGGAVLGGSLPLLRGALAPHRSVAGHVPGRLLRATEQLVE